MVTSLRKRKSLVPAGRRNTKKANATCKAMPHRMTLMLTRRLFVEKRKRKPMKKRTPIADTRLYIPMEDTIATNGKIGKEKKAKYDGRPKGLLGEIFQ